MKLNIIISLTFRNINDIDTDFNKAKQQKFKLLNTCQILF